MLEPLLMNGANALIYNTYYYCNEISQVTVASASNVRDEHRYNITNSNYSTIWNLGFNWAKNAKHMHDLAVNNGDVNYQAIGLTLKVYYLQLVTDVFGGIPYQEALQGDSGLLKPRVETQKEVYEGMIADLERANSLYNTSAVLPKKEKDAMFQGDILKWKKFTNSLLLRVLMRVSGRSDEFSPTIAQRIRTVISDPATYPVLSSNDDNALVKYAGTDTYNRNEFNTNSYGTENGFSGDHHVAEQIIKMMVDEDTNTEFDPRLRIWAKPRAANGYAWKGAVSGCSIDYGNSNKQYETFMHYETLVRDNNPNCLMDYAEILFIKAEAAFHGWIDGSAKEYYEQALTASCQKWAAYGQYAAFPDKDGNTAPVIITSADIQEFLANEHVAYDGTLQRIAEQKWLSLFWVCGFEMYNEMRRTGYPEVVIGKAAREYGYTKGLFIARWGYPTIAMANNNANYMAALAAMGGTENNKVLPVWWSGQAVARDAGTPWEHSFRKLIYGDK